MNGPTLAELRAGCQKPHFRTRGNWYARRIVRPSAVLGTWLFVRLGVSAHVTTACAWLCGLAACAALGCNQWLSGALLLQAWYFLDHVDGQLARWGRTESLDGVQLDYLMHHCLTLFVPVAIGWGVAEDAGERGWHLLGLAWGGGALLLKLWDDALYKSFFQRLKRLHGELHLVGGAGLPPGTAAVQERLWRRSLRAARTALEMHVLLNLLTLLGVARLWAGPATQPIAAGLLIAGAALAPTFFCTQLVRGLDREAAEQQFKRWFRLPPGMTLRVEHGQWYVEPMPRDALSHETLHAEQSSHKPAQPCSGGRGQGD